MPNGTLTSLGSNSKTTFLATEEDKITIEFTTAAVVKKGQPVKLTPAGLVTPWATTDGVASLIGYVYADAASGDLVTVWSKGFIILYGLSNAIQNAGPVAYTSYDSTTDIGSIGYSKYAAATDPLTINGWSLDAATAAGQLIRVLLMN